MTHGERMSLAAICVLAAVAFYLAIVGLAVDVHDDRERRIEQQLCAFRFEEDGSATLRTDDGERIACMYQHGYRAR